MSPPWLLHSFPQASPGNGVLLKCTRPCFLTWSVDLARLVLGASVIRELARVMSIVGLPLSGVVARPLYACTGDVPDGMPPILTTVMGRSERLCHTRAGCCGRAPASNSVRLRVLLLYALTANETGEDLPARMEPFRAVLHAPPQVDLGDPLQASPLGYQMDRGSHWRYDIGDSDQIWYHAAPFRGTAPE